MRKFAIALCLLSLAGCDSLTAAHQAWRGFALDCQNDSVRVWIAYSGNTKSFSATCRVGQ